MKVLNPVAEHWSSGQRFLAPRLDSLEGKRIGFLDNNYHNADVFLTRIEALIKASYKTSQTFSMKKEFKWSAAAPQLLDEMSSKAEAVVVGVGH